MDQNQKPINALVVDDEDVIVDLIAEELTAEGINCFKAFSGNQAIEIIEREKIHIVITDVRMDDGDGIDLLNSVRKIHPKKPVMLMMTGFSEYNGKDLLEKGANKVLPKPFNMDDLLTVVRETVEDIKS